MTTGISAYQRAFEHEAHANHAMLKMLAGVPEAARTGSRFQRAVNLASHMCACRSNFLKVIQGNEADLEEWFEQHAAFDPLERRFEEMEAAWRAFLAHADEATLHGSFTFADNGHRWRMSTEAQLFQLTGHAAYHRGQVVLLVDELGGETFDTDYIGWFEKNVPEGWSQVD